MHHARVFELIGLYLAFCYRWRLLFCINHKLYSSCVTDSSSGTMSLSLEFSRGVTTYICELYSFNPDTKRDFSSKILITGLLFPSSGNDKIVIQLTTHWFCYTLKTYKTIKCSFSLFPFSKHK